LTRDSLAWFGVLMENQEREVAGGNYLTVVTPNLAGRTRSGA